MCLGTNWLSETTLKSLDELVDLAIRLDNRVRERHRERERIVEDLTPFLWFPFLFQRFLFHPTPPVASVSAAFSGTKEPMQGEGG